LNRRAIVVHILRLAVVAAIVWLVHAIDGRRAAADRERPLEGEAMLQVVRRHLPEAAAFGDASAAVGGGRDLLDVGGRVVGTALRTSPAGDAAIGFSGPTDLVVVCDAGLAVAGVEILSSHDTRDHVRAVEGDRAFFESFRGRSLASLAERGPRRETDAVAGATLTSLAIREAIALRLGGGSPVSRFARHPDLSDLRLVHPEAAAIEADPGDASVIRVADAAGIPLGFAIRTSPAADSIIGYQGPTDAIVGFDAAGRVCGVAVLESFDNEPYVGYVRDDRRFRGLWRGMTIESLAGLDAEHNGVEGVSGATMTSQAVARGILAALRQHAAGPGAVRPAGLAGLIGRIEGPQWGAIAVILAGVATAFTRLRGGRFGRIVLPLVVIGYLGFGAGALVSQAQVWGWAKAGVPTGAAVLVVLAVLAVVLPATTRRNVYCSHLCAHGAAQQLLVRIRLPGRAGSGAVAVPSPTASGGGLLARLRSSGRGIGPVLRRGLVALPWLLLAVAILATLLDWPLELVDLEPFDAWLPAVAGAWVIVLAVGSLLASAIWPMAYCRHGCPTGALLDHLRLHRRSDRITWRDGILAGCLVVALLTWATA
jgi:NosR/NirI family nitrous oxide reductase transcriptional regulator